MLQVSPQSPLCSQQRVHGETGSATFFAPGIVPCNGCTRCCQNDAVRLLPGDDKARYQTESHPYFPGQRMLAHKPNGDCIYLTESGCGIHPFRPTLCREMDCRLLHWRMTIKQARKSGILDVWKRGGDLLAEGRKNECPP